MNYEELPNEVIEMHVHSALGLPGDGTESKSYCSNPSDAWGIIVESLISIEYIKYDSWMAVHTHGFDVIEVVDKKPLRAAMICFLKMKELEK